MTTTTLNGNDYTPDDFADRGHIEEVTRDGETMQRWQAMWYDGLKDMGKALTTTSASSVSVGTGSKTFVLAADRPFAEGAFIIAARTSAPTTTWLHGQVTDYDSETQTMIVNVLSVLGSGTYTDWTIQVSGPQGTAGEASLAAEFAGATTQTALPDADVIIAYTGSAYDKITAADFQLQLVLASQVFS